MAANFSESFERTMDWEDPRRSGILTFDSGGATRWGISNKAYPDVDISNLTLEEAKAIYERDYWLPLFDGIASQPIANKLFDMCVNMGVRTAIRLCQYAVNDLGERVAVDGRFGPVTVAAVNACDEVNLLAELRIQSVRHYERLADENPEKYKKYLKGWLKRAKA